MFQRRDRVVELIKQELSEIIRTLKDPRLGGLITVTGVDMTRDMKSAKVYYSVMGTEEQKKETVKIMERSAGYMRHRLRERMTTKIVPVLEFLFDDTPARAQRVEEILSRIQEEEGSGEPPKPS